MYTVLLFLLLLANSFTTMPAMGSSNEEFPFHQVVHKVANGYLDGESAQKEIATLFSQNKSSNTKDKTRFITPVRLSAHYCVERPLNFDNQFIVLKLLLGHGKTDTSFQASKEEISEDLTEATQRLAVYQKALTRSPFKVTNVSGGGSFINNEDGDERDKNKAERIKRVAELL